MRPHAPLTTSSAVQGGDDNLLAALVHELPDARLVLDAHSGLVLETNGVVRGLLDPEPAWLAGRRLDDLCHPPAEAPLAERANRYGLVVEGRDRGRFDNAIAGILQTTRDGRYIAANRTRAAVLYR